MFPYAGTVCKMRDLREANYMIPLEFEYFNMNQFEAIDIDEQEEFELAQVLYNHYK
jgi:CMP-N-acetylneuraminic acid synthetase